MATGFVSQCALADELNRRGIPTARGGSWHRTTVVRVLLRLGLITSRQRSNVLALKQAAESRAHALAPTMRKLIAAGFVSRRALAHELNRRGIPAPRGGSWHYATVVRMLTRLGLLTSGKGGRINNGLASKQAADAQAKALASTIRALQTKGLVSFSNIARALNERKIPTTLGGKWHPTSVKRLLERLKRLSLLRGDAKASRRAVSQKRR